MTDQLKRLSEAAELTRRAKTYVIEVRGEMINLGEKLNQQRTRRPPCTNWIGRWYAGDLSCPIPLPCGQIETAITKDRSCPL